MLPSRDAIHIPKAGELVANELRRRIVAGDLQPGDQLLPEGQLADEFQVARTSVREALRILESEGLVRMRRGAVGGAQVRDPDPRTLARYASLLLQFEGATLEDVHRARILIEPPAARWLVEHPDHAAIAGELSGALGAENASRDNPEELAKMEGHFHQLVTRLTGNETLALLCAVSNLIVAHHVDRFFENRRRIKRDAGAGFDAAHRAHVRLVEMIAAGDGREVEQLWRRHLEEALVSLRPLGRMTVLELMS
jgi:DNA-binding FadR family transcriptional regulator